MRSPHLRVAIVLLLAVALVAVFLRNVDLAAVGRQILHASPMWLAFSLLTMLVNLAIRAWRWQYLLEPIGHTRFGPAFRATAVGFAASAVLPGRAGEVIRPYFLSRQQQNITATGAFATVILERLLDMVAVLTLLAVYVAFFAPAPDATNEVAFRAVKWGGTVAGAAAIVGLGVLFLLAGNPARLAESLARLEAVLPSTLAGLLARVAEKFATGLGAVRRPGRLAVSLLLSFPLWLSIAAGIWAVAVAFHLAVPFAGSFLVIALLTVGVAVPTPGAVGGFHEAFRVAATTFFGAAEAAAVGAAIVLHLFTVGPSLLLGLLFAAHEGLNLSRMRTLAEKADTEGTV
ncbi:MAG: flippase-like domain-containing protein [Acidobacteria bacterium]|nr:flippase-like domain-containing protein [Acidobacteriota bacterium]